MNLHHAPQESTGRPLGSSLFVADPERRLDRKLQRQKPGRKPAAKSNQE
jgi:hypothetical protein